MNQHTHDPHDESDRLGPLLRADAATLRPTLPTASQVRWRRETLHRLERRDRRTRRAAWPAQAALAALAAVLGALIVATVIAAASVVGPPMTDPVPIDGVIIGWCLGLSALVATAMAALHWRFPSRIGRARRGAGNSSSP